MSNVTFPDVLFVSSDFGGDDLVLSPEAFAVETENCRENFGADFDPEYTEWDKVAGSEDLYSTVDVRTQDGKTQMTTLTVQATWSEANGSFKLREVDLDDSGEDNSEDEFWHRPNTEQWDRESSDDA